MAAETWTRGIGDLALGVASMSLSSANMSAPLLGVLKIEPDVMVPKGVLQKEFLTKRAFVAFSAIDFQKQFYVQNHLFSPVVRGGRVAVELELSRKVECAVEQLVRRVRAEARKTLL